MSPESERSGHRRVAGGEPARLQLTRSGHRCIAAH